MERKDTEKYLMIFILVAFLVYIGWLIYLFIDVQPEEGGLESQPLIQDSLAVDSLAIPEADSLLAVLYNAFESEDYEKAQQVARELQEKYPGSPHAEMAAKLMEALDPSLSGEKTTPVASKAARPPSRKVAPPSQKPAAPPARERETTADISAPKEIFEAVPPLEEALSKLRSVRDGTEGITWYYNKNVTHYLYKNSFEAYIGHSDEGKTWLRLRIYFSGKEPLIIQTYDVYADDKEYVISVQQGKIYRGQGVGGAWEWLDMPVSPREYMIIKRVMNAGRTALRYKGENGSSQRTLTEPEKIRLLDIINAYNALAGQNEFVLMDVAPVL